MSDSAIDVERVVREVMRRLADALPAGTSPATCESAGQETKRTVAPPSCGASEGELVVADRVVTLATLDGRLADVRRVAVRPDAIVTPAVRDTLRERKVALVAAEPGRSVKSPLAAAIRCGADCDLDVIRQACGDGVRLETFDASDLRRAVARLAAVAGERDRLGLLLTRQVAAAVCLANRDVRVRAATAGCVEEVAAAVAAIGVNALVIDPQKSGQGRIASMIEEFTRGGPRRCPATWND